MIKIIEHKFIHDLIQLEKEQTFAGRSIIGSNKLLVVGTFNPLGNMVYKKNYAEWFYGRKTNNFWRHLPECFGYKSLKEKKKEEWEKFCNDNKIVIVDLIKSFKAKDKLKSFSDIEIEKFIKFDSAKSNYFNPSKAFIKSEFEFVIFTRKTWGNDIPTLKMAKEAFVKNLLIAKSINSINQTIYCPAPWGNYTKRTDEWKSNLKIIKNK